MPRTWSPDDRSKQREKMAVARRSRWKRYSSDALLTALAVLPKVRTW